MSRFPRYLRRQLEADDQRNIDRAIPPEDNTRYTNTPAGDTRKLRGIPAVGRGVAGAIHGTSPLGELMAKAPGD